MYDEVIAVEFCIALAKSLYESKSVKKSAILLKNGKSLRSVNRILDIKEQRQLEEDEKIIDNISSDINEDMSSYKEKNENSIEEEDLDGIGSIFEYNDFDDFDEIGSIGSSENDDDDNDHNDDNDYDNNVNNDSLDLDSFRQQLLSDWNNDDSNSKNGILNEDTTPKETQSSLQPYRIGSLFGDRRISQGADMFDNVLSALSENAIPAENRDDEDAVIILSAFSKEEMIAIRKLVATYKSTKTFIFVNCKLDPMPRELIRATTVYSISPLIARPVVSENNIFGRNASMDTPQPTKIVLMRRFPRDWELFVDTDGSGFEMVDSISAASVPAKGPSNDWVASCVKQYMAMKFNGPSFP